MANQDIDLVKRIIQRDPRAAEELVDRFRKMVEYFVKKRIGAQNDDWQDITQKTFIVTIQKIETGDYKPGRSILGPYISGIMGNFVRNYLRRQQQKSKRMAITSTSAQNFDQENEIENLPASEDDQLSNVIRDEKYEILRKEIQKLPEKYRQVLDLYVNEKLEIKEIAERLEIPTKKVTEIKHQAVNMLRKKLAKKLKK